MDPTPTPTPPPTREREWKRKRIGQIVAIAAMMALARFAAGQWPRDQTIHYVLVNEAPLVQELRARWAPERPEESPEKSPKANREMGKADDWTREVAFRYAQGQAPRIVTHEPRLPNGDYTVEIEITASGVQPQDRSVVRRHVELNGGVTSIDLSSCFDHAPARAGDVPSWMSR